jgi:putative ABC transport system permease protein
MIKNLITIAIRLLKKNSLFSIINILGLSIGLAASIIIYLWVYDELSYDEFHENSENIYRVERDMTLDGQRIQVPITSPPTAPQIMADFPEVRSFTRLAYEDVLIEGLNKDQNTERIFYADSSFFDIFSFDVMVGNPSSCLEEPFTVTMSETAAKKYFGPEPELGSVVNINFRGELKPLRLTAIFEDFPHNSHIQADIIVSFSSLKSLRHEMMMTSWLASFHYSYILLSDNTDPQKLEEGLQTMVEKYFGPDIRNYLGIENPREFLTIKLVPITDIHLTANRTWEIEPPGSENSVFIFSLVSVLLLVIAGINFMNLSTARASRRALEVGIRKVSGASKRQLIQQFLGESLFFSFIALIFSLFFIELALPSFSVFTGKDLSSKLVLESWNPVIILGVWILTALLSGLYPAFFLSSYKPAAVLKGSRGRNGAPWFRKALVVGQFAISVGLIICAITVYRQLQYINEKDLGYERAGLLDIPVEDRTIYQSWDALKKDLLAIPEVENLTRSLVIPTSHSFTDNPHLLRDNPKPFFPIVNRTDENFIPVMGISMLAGQNFQPDMMSDSLVYYIINDKARKMFGFKTALDAVGEEIGLMDGGENESRDWGQIVGVCEDFHFQALTEEIKPMVISSSSVGHNHITLRVDENKESEANQKIREVWEQYYPGKIYKSNFIEEDFNAQHITESRLQSILLIFTFLSVFVACLGLLGLSIFSLEQRRKEIGIRKSLGAEVAQIVTLISAEFSRLILISNLIAVPIAYFILREWLRNFPYHRNLEIWVFIAAALVAWMAALITILVQTYRAGRLNPAEVLKYE